MYVRIEFTAQYYTYVDGSSETSSLFLQEDWSWSVVLFKMSALNEVYYAVQEIIH